MDYTTMLAGAGFEATGAEVTEMMARHKAGGQPRDKRESYVWGWADEDAWDLAHPESLACHVHSGQRSRGCAVPKP